MSVSAAVWKHQGPRRLAMILAIGLLIVRLGHPLHARAIEIELQVLDQPGEGFNDPVFGLERLSALTFAADLWGSFFAPSFPGQTVTVAVSMDLPPSGEPFTGGAGAPFYHIFPDPLPGVLTETLYPIALAEHIVGADLNSGQPDARLFFGESAEYYLGTDGNAGDRTDFVTVALHELGHAFGFDSTIAEDGTFATHRIAFTGETTPIPARLPTIYTRFVIDEFGRPLVDLLPEDRVAAATSGDGLFWGGPGGIEANGGSPPHLSAPFTTTGRIATGVAIAHLSRTFGPPPSLMTATVTADEFGRFRNLSPVEIGIYQDLGWDIAPAAVPEPPTIVLLCLGALALLSIRAASGGRMLRRPRVERR